MSPSPNTEGRLKQSAWLGIVIGWLSQLGLKTLLPTLVLVGIRTWSVAADNQAVWLENPNDSSHPAWYALQAAIVAGSAVAGALAALLSPRRAYAVPVALVGLSLLATWFEQFPSPLSGAVAFVWAGGPCIGLLMGWALAQLHLRGGP